MHEINIIDTAYSKLQDAWQDYSTANLKLDAMYGRLLSSGINIEAQEKQMEVANAKTLALYENYKNAREIYFDLLRKTVKNNQYKPK